MVEQGTGKSWGHPLEGFCQAKKILRSKKSGIRQNVVKHAVLRRQLEKIKIDKLVDEHERSFWKGFEEESTVFLDKEEIKTRKTYEKALGDGIETRKAAKKGRNLAR